MIEIEKIERDRREDFLFAVALCLIVGVVLLIAAAIIRWVGLSEIGLSTRLRIQLIAESANVATASTVLAAVAALTFLGADRITRARPLVVVTLVVGTAILLLAAYTVFDLLTVHIPTGSNGDGSATFVLTDGSALSQRLALVLPAIGTAFIAIVALVGANRLGGVIDHRGFDDAHE